MRLRELQMEFQSSVLRRASAICVHVGPSETMSAELRLSIYRSAYFARLQEALATTYPATLRALGLEPFASACEELAVQAPSRFASIRYYGEGFDRVVARHCASSIAECVRELASWEWHVAYVFDAQEAMQDAVELDGLAPDAWTSLVFPVTSTARRVQLSSNAVDFWRESAHTLARAPASQWVLWRRELQVHFRKLEADEAWALDQVLACRRFDELCAGLARWHSDEGSAALRAATLLKDWIALGLVAVR